jgi:GH24 family phage-related lysozyme (muramidase)
MANAFAHLIPAGAPAQDQAETPAPLEVPAGDGTRANPVKVKSADDLRRAGDIADPEPTEPRKDANNYRHGHLKLHGLDISIETPQGAKRRGVDSSGKPWEVTMPVPYGYIKGTVGHDKDHIDAFLGPDIGSDKVYVIDQVDPESGSFDEHKLVFGAKSGQDAQTIYSKSYSDDRPHDRIGNITEMSVDDARTWLKSGKTKAPINKEFLPQGADRESVLKSATLVKDMEGFQESPYWDANAYRVGYGSDTVTTSDGKVLGVKPGMKITKADADRDLARRVADVQKGIKSRVGEDAWGGLSADQQAAVTSVAYNYGELPKSVAKAVRAGNAGEIGAAIGDLASDNDGVNAERRKTEAGVFTGETGAEGGAKISGKGKKNAFAHLIPQKEAESQGEQTPNIGAKGNMKPGDKPITDVQSQFLKSATFNFGDEIVAGMTVPVEMAVNAATGEGPTDPYEAYQQIRAFQNAQDAATREQKPIASTAASIGGALMPAGGGLKFVSQGANLLTKGGRAALAGGVIGGVSGAGEGETIDERLANAKRGAELGAVIGGVAPGAGKIVGQGYRLVKAVSRAASAPIRSLAGKETFAAQKVAEALKRDALTPERTAVRLDKSRAVKPETVLADVAGTNTQKLLRAAANVPSEGREKVAREIFKRQDQQLNRLRGDVSSAFGDTKTFHQTVEGLSSARKLKAKPLFDKAFNTGTPFTSELESVLNRPLTKKLVEQAKTAAENRGENFRSLFMDKNGNVRRVIDTEGLHRVKMQIDDTINKLKNRQETGLGNVGMRDLTILKRDLLNAIRNPEYKTALKQYAGDSAAVNALDEGFEDFLKSEPEMITKRLTDMSPGEADLARLGLARKVVNQLRDSGRAGTDRADILYSPKYLDRIRAAFKDVPSGREFMRKLMLERRMSRTRQSLVGNSSTASQLAEGGEAGAEAENIRHAADLGGKLVRGDMIGALVSWVGRAKNMATGLRPEVADEIIRMLTSKDPAKVRQAQQLVEKEVAKLTKRQGMPKRVEQGVTLMGLGAIPSLNRASSGGQ